MTSGGTSSRARPRDAHGSGDPSGPRTLSRAREQANAQAEEYLARAEATLRQETQQARQQLRQEVADLAVMAASRIVRKELDSAAQTRLIEEALAETAPSTNGGAPTATGA